MKWPARVVPARQRGQLGIGDAKRGVDLAIRLGIQAAPARDGFRRKVSRQIGDTGPMHKIRKADPLNAHLRPRQIAVGTAPGLQGRIRVIRCHSMPLYVILYKFYSGLRSSQGTEGAATRDAPQPNQRM